MPHAPSSTEVRYGHLWRKPWAPDRALSTFTLPAAFLGDRRVILLEQVLVLGHELFARVLVHLLAKFIGEVAPDVFVKIGNLAHLAALTCAPARIVACLLSGLAHG